MGSAFTVVLPLPAVLEHQKVNRVQRDASSFDKTHQTHVLVAEDNEINQMVAQRMLEKLGCQVSIAADGAEAIEMAVQGTYDLILMDLQMPHVTGVEACKHILGELDDAPHIVAMTANVLEDEQQRCIDAGMSDFLAKPVKLEGLRSCLHKHGLDPPPQ